MKVYSFADAPVEAKPVTSGGYRTVSTGTGKEPGVIRITGNIKDEKRVSYQSYLSGKNKYGSSSAWFDAATKEQQEKKNFVETLEAQLSNKQKSGRDRYHLPDKQIADGKTAPRPWMSENWSRDDGKSVEDLQKELEKAQAELKRADEDLKYAAEWRYYDADMAWMDTVKNSGQDWGFVSDNLSTMASNLTATYNQQLEAYKKAQQQNERVDLARRQGGVPSEIGYIYTSDDELAKMYAELTKTGDLLDMANRRYGYSLDELGKDSKIVESGRLKNEQLLAMDAQTAERNMDEYVQSHVKGDTLGALRESYRNDKTAFRPTEEWNETQLNRYYVLLDRQGEQAAAEYAVDVNSYINATKEQEASQQYYDWGYAADANGWSKTGRGLVGTVATVAAMPGELGEYINKVERVAYTGAYVGDGELKLHDKAHAITQGRADSLNELGTIGDKGLGDLYQLTNSMAQSLVYGNLAGSAGTLTLFFGAAANQGFDEAMSRGATGEQAMTYGMLSGIAEAAAEIIPLENLLNADKSMARGLLKSVMIQAGLEGAEEGETNALNMLADRLVMGDKNAMTTAINERIAQGESYGDAVRAEWGNFVKDTVWSMLGGAISGASSATIQHGIAMAKPYTVDDDGGSLYGADAQTLGREAAALPGKENKSIAALGKHVEKKAASGGKVSNYTAQKLAKKINRVAMLDAVKKQISERAENIKGDNVGLLANAIVSEVRGERPGPKGKQLMEANKDLSEALISEMDVGKPAAWAQKIGMRGVEGLFYGDKDEIAIHEKVKADAKVIKANGTDPMSETVTIPTSKGEVSGTVVGLDMNKGKPRFIIQGENNKREYVPVDEAVQSGALPEGVGRLAWEVLGEKEIAVELFQLYSPGQDIEEYVTNMTTAIDLASNVSRREVFNKDEAVRGLTKEQRSFAWNDGLERREKKQKRHREAQTHRKQNKALKKGTVSFEGVTMDGRTFKATTKDKVKAADLRVIERIAKAANVNVVFYESDSIDGLYQGANGFYHNGTVYLDVHAGASKTTQQDAILLTAAHELTHHIRVNAEAQYDALKEFVIEHLIENGHDYETMVQDKLKEKDMTRADAVEEVIADACEMVLKDSKAVEKLAKENKSLAQTIADWLHGFYDDIKAAFEGVEARSKEAKAMTDYMDELVKLWDDALIEASHSESKQSGKVKEQARSTKNNKQGEIDKYFIRQIEQWDGRDHGGSFRVGKVSEPLLMVGMPDVDIWFDQSKAAKQLSEKEEITKEELKRIPEILNNPIAIAESYDNTVLVFGEMYDKHGNPIVIAIRINSTNRRNHITVVNKVRSIGSRRKNLDKLLAEENILYLKPNKKETNNWFNALGRSTPFGGTKFGLIRIISENGVNSNSEVKYSRRDTSEGLTKEEARAQAQAYTRLKAENAALQRRLDYWHGQTKETKQRLINRNDVDKFAKRLVKIHGSKLNRKWLSRGLYAMGDYIVQNDELNHGHLQSLAWKLATEVVVNAEAVDDSNAYDNREQIMFDIKRFKFHLDESYKNDLPYGFRKQYSGKLHISYTEGRGVDSIYQELQNSYGKTLFPDMPTPADMLVMIGEAYDTVSAPPKVYNPYHSNMNEAISSVANDILETMLSGNIRQASPTVRDRAETREQKAVQKGRDSVKRLREQKNARIDEIKRHEASRRKEVRAKEKAAKWEKVDAVKGYYQDMIKRERAERKESAATQKYRASVYKSLNTLTNLLLKNSDKEHVPEALKAPLLEMLTSLDLSSARLLKKGESTKLDEKYTKKMQALRDVLGRQQAYMEKPGEVEGLNVFLDLPSGFDEVLKQHIEAVDRIMENHKMATVEGPIAFMNSAQLQELDMILTVLTRSISQINSFITESRYESVKEGARESREYMRSLGTEIERNIAKDRADKFLAWSNALPIYVFKRFGESGQERFNALVNGWDQMAKNVESILAFVEGTYETEEVTEWENEVHEINLSDGRTAQMTTAQIMGLYCSFKREQARQHLLKGGMRVGDIETKKGKKISQTEAYHLTHDDIINITKELSDRQIEVANKLQEFLNTVCSDWGNEISMARFGYRQFTEDSYYPITTDPNNHPAVDPKARENDIFRLLNMAFTKQLNPNANNSIDIFSIFDVFSAHAADMAKYNALALPILDLMKWYNYKDTSHTDVEDSQGNVNRQLRAESVQSMTERAYGKQAQNYMINFLKDLNGTREGGRNEDVLKGFLGKYKSAAVGANLRVALQQPTSIVRASYLLNPVYLAKGASMKGGIEEALEYSGLAKWKSMGYFDTNLSRGMRRQIKHDESTMDKLRDKSMKLAELGDRITWGAIWNACKLEQEDKGLTGDELIKATTERFNEVILSTQVMDSTISRSDMMRSNSLALKELTSFMSEPTVSYNMLLDSVMQFETVRRQTGNLTEARRQTWPIMGRALSVFVTSTMATAAAAAIIDAMRDDDEYQNFIEKWLEHLKSNWKQSINPLNILPILGEAVSIALGKETHDSMLYQPLTQLNKATTAVVDLWRIAFNSDKELNDPNRTNWGRLYQIGQAASSISGLPIAGFMREFKTVWNMSGGIGIGKKLKTYDSGIKNEVKYGVLDGYISEEEAIAILSASGEYANPDDIYWQVQEWLHAEDDSEWTRYDELNAAMLAGDINAFKTAQENLGDHGIEPRSVRAYAKGQLGKWFMGEEGIPAKINEAAALTYLQDFAGLTPIEAQHQVDEWKFEKVHGIKYSELKDAYVAGTFTKEQTINFLKNVGHEYHKDAVEKAQEWTCEKETGIQLGYLSEAYIYGEITDKQAVQYLQEYGGNTQSEAETKVAQWGMVMDYGVKYSSTDAGIKKNLIEGYITPEGAKAMMITFGGKTPEEAEDYVNQYLFTEETGYAWSEIEEAYADGIIDYEEMVEWYMRASIYTHGSEEVAREYAEVAQWKKDIPDADSISRTALEKWNTKGDYMQRAGLNRVDFTEAWSLYSSSYAQYDANGNKVKEKAQVFFEKLYSLMKKGVYTEDEIDAIARTVYSKSYVNKYAMW